jgi:hypothetical protein
MRVRQCSCSFVFNYLDGGLASGERTVNLVKCHSDSSLQASGLSTRQPGDNPRARKRGRHACCVSDHGTIDQENAWQCGSKWG